VLSNSLLSAVKTWLGLTPEQVAIFDELARLLKKYTALERALDSIRAANSEASAAQLEVTLAALRSFSSEIRRFRAKHSPQVLLELRGQIASKEPPKVPSTPMGAAPSTNAQTGADSEYTGALDKLAQLVDAVASDKWVENYVLPSATSLAEAAIRCSSAILTSLETDEAIKPLNVATHTFADFSSFSEYVVNLLENAAKRKRANNTEGLFGRRLQAITDELVEAPAFPTSEVVAWRERTRVTLDEARVIKDASYRFSEVFAAGRRIDHVIRNARNIVDWSISYAAIRAGDLPDLDPPRGFAAQVQAAARTCQRHFLGVASIHRAIVRSQGIFEWFGGRWEKTFPTAAAALLAAGGVLRSHLIDFRLDVDTAPLGKTLANVLHIDGVVALLCAVLLGSGMAWLLLRIRLLAHSWKPISAGVTATIAVVAAMSVSIYAIARVAYPDRVKADERVLISCDGISKTTACLGVAPGHVAEVSGSIVAADGSSIVIACADSAPSRALSTGIASLSCNDKHLVVPKSSVVGSVDGGIQQGDRPDAGGQTSAPATPPAKSGLQPPHGSGADDPNRCPQSCEPPIETDPPRISKSEISIKFDAASIQAFQNFINHPVQNKIELPTNWLEISMSNREALKTNLDALATRMESALNKVAIGNAGIGTTLDKVVATSQADVDLKRYFACINAVELSQGMGDRMGRVLHGSTYCRDKLPTIASPQAEQSPPSTGETSQAAKAGRGAN
jgi:hypothetical protein